MCSSARSSVTAPQGANAPQSVSRAVETARRSAASIAPPVQRTIDTMVSQHAEQASFLWTLRDRAVDDAAYTLENLETLDSRVEAHVDGLRVAGRNGLDVVRATYSMEEAGEVFATTVMAMEPGAAVRPVFDSVLEAPLSHPDVARGLISALAWIPFSRIEHKVAPLLVARSPAHRRIAIAAYAAHRRDPGPPLAKAIACEDDARRARALRVVGELGLVEHQHR